MPHDGFAGLGQFAVAATLRRKIEDDGAGRHAFHHFFRDKYRRFLARDDRSGDDDVAFLDDASEKLPLLFIEAFILRAGVAAGILGVFGFDWQFNKASTQTLDLFFSSGT